MNTFTFSDYLASAALVASAMSALYTKRQSEWARVSARNDYRAQLSEQHASYRKALSEVRNRHKIELSKLSELAATSLTRIIERADEHDSTTNGSRPCLRHLLHDCSEMVFYAFRGQLAWQTGLNISMRLLHVRTIEDDLEPHADYFSKGGTQQSFERRYRKHPNASLEIDLRHDRRFCSLVSQLKSRIGPRSGTDFLVDFQNDLIPFRNAYEASLPGLRESVERLEGLLEEGQAEHFPLHESPQLFSVMRREKTLLDTLSHLNIPQIDPASAIHYDNYISLSIHACAVLHAISRTHSWGWHYPYP